MFITPIKNLHRDERGTISIVSVFTALLLAMLLGMVMNAGRQIDGKIRMQNAADSAAYSGGVVMARGMNTIVFTNHLLCDVFALTAYMREANNQNSTQNPNSASYAQRILTAWNNVAKYFANSPFPKFSRLGAAIQQKTPLEQAMVSSYSSWAQSVSQNVLPMMEEILSGELIPQYQRAVVAAFPDIAQSAARETAALNGEPELKRGKMLGVLWRTDAQTVGGSIESTDNRTLPVIDPEKRLIRWTNRNTFKSRKSSGTGSRTTTWSFGTRKRCWASISTRKCRSFPTSGVVLPAVTCSICWRSNTRIQICRWSSARI